MRKIGLVGGISWTSTIDYYRYINEGVNQALGGLQSAEIVLNSLNFADIQDKGWENSFDLLLDACIELEKSNVEGIALCANTAHLFAGEIQEIINIPIVDIITATAKEINSMKINKIGLLGTKFTMEMDFYRRKLNEYQIEVFTPEKPSEIDHIQYVVKEELGKGIIKENSKKEFIKFSNDLIQKGAQGIVLGCTEIPLLINENDFDSIPVFDTTKIHVQAILDFILDEN
ncbi:racemase [Neptunitalea chrysea]|uniref:Racemase n=1 Tax=Neptunitalea chrysea TaxID=1647581 RepID=A0A9W6B732_9FLAO|nr:amino acid racemase [Neptunitalea chrysea]GLB54091.1 racemase [Neptunitalea chrysea]